MTRLCATRHPPPGGLGSGHIPEGLDAALQSALDSSEAVIARSLHGSSVSPERSARMCEIAGAEGCLSPSKGAAPVSDDDEPSAVDGGWQGCQLRFAPGRDRHGVADGYPAGAEYGELRAEGD